MAGPERSARAKRRVLVTRAAEDAERWAEELGRRGYEAECLPCITVQTLEDPKTASRVAAALEGAGFVALTSRRAVDALVALGGAALEPHQRVAVVGPATERAALAVLGRVDLVAEKGTGADLAERIAEAFEAHGEWPRKVAVPSADRAQRHIENRLESLGVEVVRVIVYRTEPAPRTAAVADLEEMGIDAVLLGSPSAAEGFVNRARLGEVARVVSIGPTTSEAARELGLPVHAEAAEPTLDALLLAVEEACGGGEGS